MKKQGYTIIEPEIHAQLAWDYEQIVQCLNAIIVNYPWMNEETNKFEIEVISAKGDNEIKMPQLGLDAFRLSECCKPLSRTSMKKCYYIHVEKLYARARCFLLSSEQPFWLEVALRIA